MHGVGVSVVNALSDHLVAIVRRNGKIFQQEYKKGNPVADVNVMGETQEHGTEISFYPDFSIMEKNEFSFDTLSQRLRELAFLNKGIKITILDERVDKKEELENHIFLSELKMGIYFYKIAGGKLNETGKVMVY